MSPTSQCAQLWVICSFFDWELFHKGHRTLATVMHSEAQCMSAHWGLSLWNAVLCKWGTLQWSSSDWLAAQREAMWGSALENDSWVPSWLCCRWDLSCTTWSCRASQPTGSRERGTYVCFKPLSLAGALLHSNEYLKHSQYLGKPSTRNQSAPEVGQAYRIRS